jgi:uroporphyrin-III C-methyltransferase/precorrin-2 dehydrogenase/sirohydrochlorin ferrochelatase
VLVVGGGPVAARRARSVLVAGAAVDVVALETVEGFPDVPVQRRAFADADVDGAWLVLACTGVVDDAVAAACERTRTWCVRADDASRSRRGCRRSRARRRRRVGDRGPRPPPGGGAPRRGRLALDTGSLPLRRHRPGPARWRSSAADRATPTC